MSTLRDRLVDGTATPQELREVVYLIDLVKLMRNAQKRYFARPERSNLMEAKLAEKKADAALKFFYDFQGGLFE